MHRTRPQPLPYLLLTLLIALDTVVFLIEKMASDRSTGEGWRLVRSFLGQPWIWAIFVLKLCQLGTWTSILARVDISLAFPLTSLAYPAAMLAAMLILHERLSWQVWLGGLLITAGAAVIGPGQTRTSDFHAAA